MFKLLKLKLDVREVGAANCKQVVVCSVYRSRVMSCALIVCYVSCICLGLAGITWQRAPKAYPKGVLGCGQMVSTLIELLQK